jgi:hypothetical protein
MNQFFNSLVVECSRTAAVAAQEDLQRRASSLSPKTNAQEVTTITHPEKAKNAKCTGKVNLSGISFAFQCKIF